MANKQTFSQRLISMMYNAKNFFAKLINVYIGKGTLIYLVINISAILISFCLTKNALNNGASFTIGFAIYLISSLLLVCFLCGKLVASLMTIPFMKKKKKLLKLSFIISFIIFTSLFIIWMVLFIADNETLKNTIEKISFDIILPFIIAPLLFYIFTTNYEKNKNKILYINNFRIKKLANTDKNAIVIQNFNTISICDAYIYQKVDGKNKFVCCKCFEPNQAIECKFDENAKEITILLSDDSGDFKVGRKNTFKLDFLDKFDYNSGRVNELEHEELMNYPLFRRKISAKAIIFDIKSTLINQKFAYEAQWANTIAELQSMQIEVGENVRNPIKNLTVTDIKDSLIKNGNMESDEQISAMMDDLGIDKLGEYNYKKEKAYRGINSFLNELYKDNKIIICAIAYGDKSGIDRFEKSYLASLFRGRIFKAETSEEAMEKALKSIEVDPEECVMVGDSIINDIAPAKSLGMQTIRVKQGLNAGVASTESVADKEIDNIKKVRFEINF